MSRIAVTRGRTPRRASAAGVRGGVAFRALASLVPILLALTTAAGATQREALRAEPSPGIPLAAASDTEPFLVWLDEGLGAAPRLVAPGPEGRVILGPDWPGTDGLPAAAGAGSGAMVVAARGNGTASRLWVQRRWRGVWQGALPGPSAARWDHHPTLAAGAGETWLIWVAEEEGVTDAGLWASRWLGGAWSAAEPLPTAPGAPGAPEAALDPQGRPWVVWSASDGVDAEVWITRRDEGGWRPPLPLTDDETPDITPDLAIAGDRVFVAWSAAASDGYGIAARRSTTDLPWDRTSWEPELAVSPGPATSPRLIAAGSGVTISFAERWDGERLLRAAASTSTGWSPTESVGRAAATRSAMAVAADGSTFFGWIDPAGDLLARNAARARGGADGPRLVLGRDTRVVASAAPAAEPSGPTARASALESIPRRFSAFGDSITNGILRNPDRVETEGYRGPLEQLLNELLGAATVINQGVDGEQTDEGVGRIDNVVRDDDPHAVLILEGTNDVLLLVDTETIALNLRRMAERVFEEKDEVLVFLSLLPPQNRDEFGGPFNRRVDEVNELLPDAASDTGSFLVDMHAPFDEKPELYSDMIHPNEDGYRVMGEAWFGAIRPEALDRTNRGDIDGSGRVDGIDLVRLALAFGASEGEERYDAVADVNQDGIVDGFDLAILAEFFGIDLSGDDGSDGGP